MYKSYVSTSIKLLDINGLITFFCISYNSFDCCIASFFVSKALRNLFNFLTCSELVKSYNLLRRPPAAVIKLAFSPFNNQFGSLLELLIAWINCSFADFGTSSSSRDKIIVLKSSTVFALLISFSLVCKDFLAIVSAFLSLVS